MERFILFLTNNETTSDAGEAMITKTISNYKSYFKSSYGGWWDESEIFHIEQAEEGYLLENLLGLNQYPYSIIIFCGPTRKTKKDIYLQINPNFEISAQKLNEGVHKRILLIDDCVSGVTNTYNQKLKKLNLFEESLYGLMLNTIECKRLLAHKNLKESPNHTIVIYAANTPSSDQVGSYYAAFLLKSARLMIKEKYQSIDFTTSFGFLRFPEIHHNTITLMKENGIKTSGIKMILSDEEINEESDTLVFAILG